jgi:hypothetical protein
VKQPEGDSSVGPRPEPVDGSVGRSPPGHSAEGASPEVETTTGPHELSLLAVFLDGRLPDQERQRLITQLSESDAGTLGVLIDAAAVLRELEETPNASEGGQLPVRDRGTRTEVLAPARSARSSQMPSRRPPRWLGFALAAAILLAVLVTITTRRSATLPVAVEERGGDPGRFADAMIAANTRVSPEQPPAWNSSPWVATRGSGAALSQDARAARLGALVTDLGLLIGTARGGTPADVQAGSNEPARIAVLADQAATLLEEVPTGAAAAAGFRELARRAVAPLGRDVPQLAPFFQSTRIGAAHVIGEERAAYGAWVEAARVAAASRNIGFFAPRAAGAPLPGAPYLDTLRAGAPIRAEVRRVAAVLESAPRDWERLQNALTNLLVALGS